MAATSVTTTVVIPTTQGGDDPQPLEFTLHAHQSKAINLNTVVPAFSPDDRAESVGGVSISHTGAPGSVIAYGTFARPATGYSSHCQFQDPAERLSNTLVASHLMVGPPDVPGFPSGTSFRATAV